MDSPRVNAQFLERANLWAVIAVEILSDPPIRLHSGIGSLTLGDDTYAGVGGLGGITGLEDSGEIRGSSFQLSLSSAPGHLLQSALSDSMLNDQVKVFVATSSDNKTWSKYVLKAGRIGITQIAVNEIAVTCYTAMTDMVETNAYNRRYTDDHQQLLHPGDRVFRFVSSIENVAINF